MIETCTDEESIDLEVIQNELVIFFQSKIVTDQTYWTPVTPLLILDYDSAVINKMPFLIDYHKTLLNQIPLRQG
uniref:Uncharacterized protein n=1 Tax=Caenorhabditis japonica TaxID=281687 RepID=A0A8R1IQZ3_CAEJA